MDIDKSKFKDDRGRYIVQGLFLEDRYNPDMAVYTFDGEDKEYKGKMFPSLKRLYLEHCDPTEYSFARKYLYDWDHWKRLRKNAVVGRHIDQWKAELDLYLMSEGVSSLINLAVNEGSYQASKWLADRGWDKSERGRPSKEDIEGQIKKMAQAEYDNDEAFQLLQIHKNKD